MGRHRSKSENTAPPEREPTEAELDELEQEDLEAPTERDDVIGAERARLELENERTEREEREEIEPPTEPEPEPPPINEIDELPTEGERAIELRRRYGWG
jgi:hypothetical protein